MRQILAIVALSFLLAGVLGLAGCAKRSPTEAVSEGEATCEGCHLNRDLLKATATSPQETSERFLVNESFVTSRHGKAGCVGCHGGEMNPATKADAHKTIVVDPSEGAESACAGCHNEIEQIQSKSVHGSLSGFATSLRARTGSSSLDENMQTMVDKQCSSCHASCGQCHISRPRSAGGGLVSGHNPREHPTQADNCAACHATRSGKEYIGRLSGLDVDVHYQAGLTCFDCHPADKLHGNGQTYDDRYAVADLPQCTNCHPDAGSEESQNYYHKQHANKVQCQVCHSISYENCYSCHVGREGSELRFPSQIDFRIGKNPRQDEKHPWNYVVLRHIPIAPDSYDDWNITLTDYSSQPTWVYASPHNIQRITPQTQPCYVACHGKQDLFLTPDYIQQQVDSGLMAPEEAEANASVVVETLP